MPASCAKTMPTDGCLHPDLIEEVSRHAGLQDLYTFALVNKIWNTFTTPVLYTSVTLCPDTGCLFLRTIKERKDLRQYVRQIHFHYKPKHNESRRFRHCADLDTAAILPLLQSLRHISIEGLNGTEWSSEDASGEPLAINQGGIPYNWEKASRVCGLALQRICYDEPGLLSKLESC